MDNDNKISKTNFNAPNIVSNFLKEDLSLKAKAPEVYSLDKEFSKTRKNKAYSIYVLITAFVILTVGFTYFITYTIQKKNENLKIDISDFRDINLKDLLEASKELGSQIKLLEKEISYLNDTKLKEISEVKDESNAKLRILWAKNLPKDESSIQEKRIKNNEWGSIKSITGKYDNQIAERSKKLAQLKVEYAEKDKKLTSGVKKTEEVIHSYGKVHELKMEQMRKFYEDKLTTEKKLFEKRTKELKELQETYSKNLILRYNPIYTSAEFKRIFKIEKDSNILSANLYKDYDDKLRLKEIFPQGRFEELRKNTIDFILIINRLDQIPFVNSVDPSIDYLNYFFRAIVKEYEERWYELGYRVIDQSDQLQFFRKALENLALKEREDGFVIGENKGTLEIVLNPYLKFKEGAHALIYAKGILKAEVSVNFDKDRYKAKILKLQSGQEIEAFDHILIKRDVPNKKVEENKKDDEGK